MTSPTWENLIIGPDQLVTYSQSANTQFSAAWVAGFFQNMLINFFKEMPSMLGAALIFFLFALLTLDFLNLIYTWTYPYLKRLGKF